MEVNDLQSARDLNFRVEHPNIDLCANFYLPSYSRDFNMPDINFPCKSSLNAPPPFTFKRPGAWSACHYARFMAKSIYSLKMSLCAKFYAMEKETEMIMRRSAIFCSLFYGPWFLMSPISQSTPRMDLEMIDQMKMNMTITLDKQY